MTDEEISKQKFVRSYTIFLVLLVIMALITLGAGGVLFFLKYYYIAALALINLFLIAFSAIFIWKEICILTNTSTML